MVGQHCEHVGEPVARVDVIELAGGNQRIDRCREPSWLENIELRAKKAIKRENIDR